MAANNVPKKREEEYITNKVLIVFSLCLAGVLILMAIKNMVNYGYSYFRGIMFIKVFMGISAVGVILGLFKIIREKQTKAKISMRILTGKNITLVSLVSLIVFALTYRYLFLIFNVFYVVLPALAVYYLVFHSYQREFFVIGVDVGIAAALLFVLRSTIFNHLPIAAIITAIMAVITVVQLIIVNKIKANSGVLKLGKAEYNFNFSKNAYTMMFITPVIMLALVAVGSFTNSTIALGAIFAMAAYLFVTAVYYTVKLM